MARNCQQNRLMIFKAAAKKSIDTLAIERRRYRLFDSYQLLYHIYGRFRPSKFHILLMFIENAVINSIQLSTGQSVRHSGSRSAIFIV